MRKERAYFAMTAAILLSISMTACGGGNAKGQIQTETEETATQETVAPASMAQETTADSAGRDGDGTTENDLPENTDIVSSSEKLPFSLGQKIESDSFTGNAYIEMMIANDETYHFPQTNHLSFEPGARSSWHSHGGMVLLITGGKGFYQEEGKAAQILRPGDVVDIEPGVKHWHGAAKDSFFAHIAIAVPAENATNEWLEPVSDKEYNKLK